MLASVRETQGLLLEALLKCPLPLESVMVALGREGWDADEPLVRLCKEHVHAVLMRYLQGTLTAGEVEQWANALEGREDIGMTPELLEMIFQLANPLLTEPLTPVLAEKILGVLGRV